MKIRAGLLVGMLFAPLVRAEVRDVHDNSFVIESTATSTASPAVAYAALVKVSAWWNPEHTWSGAAKNLSLQPRAGGCFCEKLAGGGSVQHGRVTFAQPGRQLRIDGALGPFQEMAVTGILTFKLIPADSGTRITLTYAVAGAITIDAKKLAPGVDTVLSDQLARLKAYADKLK